MSNTVYVGNLDSKVNKALLYELFVQAGPISSIRFPKDKQEENTEHPTYAFIKFVNDEVDYVCKLFDHKVSLYGKPLKVKKSNKQTEAIDHDVGAKLFVKDLDESIDVPQLCNIFKTFGQLLKKPEVFYLRNGTLRCAYVWYTTFKHSDDALNRLNNTNLANKVITVDYAYKDDKQKTLKHGDEIERLLDTERQKNYPLMN
ncbi:unnamed protein product [Kluyveromyces dobzhanskii CBS 2104]|uniref:WGS project CCBQ000000000 data, contig 00041 n=1 Tax=Kluyveromyces dobzhanskii CBS 2104 TaxID=1427455 RepID=A0A0A8L0F0_9SACH|nr:unnamed protein product [Kluyveromyces dobzhanskii CBS 2104]